MDKGKDPNLSSANRAAGKHAKQAFSSMRITCELSAQPIAAQTMHGNQVAVISAEPDQMRLECIVLALETGSSILYASSMIVRLINYELQRGKFARPDSESIEYNKHCAQCKMRP